MAQATASKSRKSRFGSYDDILKHTEQPLARRRVLAIGRGGEKVVPRRYHLTADEIDGMKETVKNLGSKATLSEKLLSINPHNKGFYHFLFAALAAHPNEDIPQTRVMARVEHLMSAEETKDDDGVTAWDRFVNKDPRNAETGKSWDARFDQNVVVLQRLSGMTPYGRRIFDLHKVLGTKGVVIDVIVNESTGTRYLRLNTNAERPINDSKVRGAGSPAQRAAEKAAKRSKTKASGKKRQKKVAAPATVADGDKADAPAPAADAAKTE